MSICCDLNAAHRGNGLNRSLRPHGRRRRHDRGVGRVRNGCGEPCVSTTPNHVLINFHEKKNRKIEMDCPHPSSWKEKNKKQIEIDYTNGEKKIEIDWTVVNPVCQQHQPTSSSIFMRKKNRKIEKGLDHCEPCVSTTTTRVFINLHEKKLNYKKKNRNETSSLWSLCIQAPTRTLINLCDQI